MQLSGFLQSEIKQILSSVEKITCVTAIADKKIVINKEAIRRQKLDVHSLIMRQKESLEVSLTGKKMNNQIYSFCER